MGYPHTKKRITIFLKLKFNSVLWILSDNSLQCPNYNKNYTCRTNLANYKKKVLKFKGKSENFAK